MFFCILGALLCGQSANMVIPGKLAYAQPSPPYSVWAYAAYYSVPILDTQRITIPEYANPLPPVVVPFTGQPGVIVIAPGRRS
jgi:hypothetical protein